MLTLIWSDDRWVMKGIDPFLAELSVLNFHPFKVVFPRHPNSSGLELFTKHEQIFMVKYLFHLQFKTLI